MTATITHARPRITGAGAPRVWACYCRLSQAKNDGKGGSLAIDRQCDENSEYIGKVDPGAVIVHFHDDGYSGFLNIWRPAFEDMMGRIVAGEFDSMTGWHADRLTRQVEVTGRIVRVCEESRTELHTTLGGWHSDPTRLYIETTVSEGESRQKRNRAISKHRQLGKTGGFSGGGRRYGYAPRMTAIREDEAAVIHEIANRLLAGQSTTSVAGWLNNAGIPTTLGSRWTTSTIKHMMTAPHLAGIREWDGKPVTATWPAILDLGTHEALKARLGKRAPRGGGGSSNRYLLSGIARCGKCQGVMGGVAAKGKTPVYRCITSRDIQRRMSDVDALVAEYVIRRLEEIDMSGALASNEDRRNLAALIAERDGIPAQREELAAMLVERRLSAAGFAAADVALSDREAELASVVRTLGEQAAAPQRALDGATGALARPAWESWAADTSGMGLARMRAVTALLVDVTFKASASGPTFDPHSVAVTYRNIG